MMREVKFRAWDKYQEQMSLNVESGVYEDPDETIDFDTVLSLERFAVMQYTGLKDMNGKEIYEKDVLESPNGVKGEVKYIPEHAAFLVHYSINGNSQYDYLEKADKCKVIGNIYQNPDLLEESK